MTGLTVFALGIVLSAAEAPSLAVAAQPPPGAQSTSAPAPDDAQTLTGQAARLSEKGRYAEAEPLYRRALDLQRAKRGERDGQTATAYNELAVNLYAQGRYADADPLYRRALEIRRASLGERNPDTAMVYGNLALNLDAQARSAEAEPLHRRALEAFRAANGEQDRDTAIAYNNLAQNLQAQGRNADAEVLFRHALDIYRGVAGDQDPDTITAYGNLATTVNAQGRYADAEPLFRRALQLSYAVTGEGHPTTATFADNLADNLRAQGRYAEAEPLLIAALAVRAARLGERHPDTATGLENLARNLDAQGRHTEAEPLHRRALQTFRALFGERHPSTATANSNLAVNLDDQGRHAEAEPLFQSALDTYRAMLGEQHPDTAIGYSNVASNLAAAGRFGDALVYSRRAVVAVRSRRARAGARAADTAQTALARAKGGDGSGDPLDFAFANFLDIGWNRAREAPAESPLAEVFTAAQDLDSSSVGQAMAQTAARTAAGGGPLGELARRQQDLSATLQRLDRQNLVALGRGDAAGAQASRAQIAVQSGELAVVNAQLTKAFPQYADLVSPRALSLEQVQARLGPDEGLLLIVPAAGSVYSFAVSRSQVAWSRADGGGASTRARVALLRCQADDATCGHEGPAPSCLPTAAVSAPAGPGAGPAFDRTAAYCLYHDLIAPVEAALGGVSKLYVTTSGPLSSLPLGALITAPPRAGEADSDPVVLAKGPWLADRYALTTLPTVSSLQVPAPGKAARTGGGSAFLGYGAPTLGDDGGTSESRGSGVLISPETGFTLADPRSLKVRLAPLPGTEVELKAMALVLKAPAGSIRLGAAATERAVRADPRLPTAQVIAFATHGLLPTDHIPGLREPGLVFTPPGTASDADDGVLAASEVSRMRFNADWIILSACNTASADGTPGADNLSSLARAFLYAGAQALLASHWRVSDEVTAALTVETLAIRRDHPELTRAEALQRAMRYVRTGQRADGTHVDGWAADWTHPGAWAPFSVIANRDR